jgi:neopullulanase
MGLPALPEFNTDHPEVRTFLLDVAEHWINFGIDGWRLDVPAEIDDPPFWREFREVVKTANPEAYLVGEIWDEAPSWLEGDQFDALMNYPLVSPILSFFGAGSLRDYSKAHLTFDPLDAETFAEDVDDVLSLYDWEVTCAQLNLLDSHDMARAQWIMGDNADALRQAVLFLMTMPGAPCIYYGDEVGLSAKGDPYCREAFPEDEADWDTDLLAFYRDATTLRHRHEVLRTGRVEWLHAEDRTVAFRRVLDDREAVVVFNAGSEAASIDLAPDMLRSAALHPAWPLDADEDGLHLNGAPAPVTIPPRAARVWVNEP